MTPGNPRAPYFVMAHHRSGSNFLNDLLQSHPRIECVNEPFSMHTGYFRDCDLEPWTARDFDPEHLHPEIAKRGSLRRYLLDFKAYLSQSNELRVVGFKETALFEKLEWLKAFMPSLKILFLKRDPRSIVSSVLRSDLLAFWGYAHLVPPAFKKLYPQYVSQVEAGDEAAAAAEVVAMSVAARYTLAGRAIAQFEHREIELGQIMREPEACLDSIAGFLGVEAHDGPLSFLKQRQSESRGGTFSSFRSRSDVEHRWESHLTPPQVRVIEEVLQCE